MNKNDRRAIDELFPLEWIKSLGLVDQKVHRYLQTSLRWIQNSPSLYRALLLAAAKPSANLKEEFYKDHSSDETLKNLTVLDPCMRFGANLAEERVTRGMS